MKHVYLFIREKHFYPLELKDGLDAIRNAELNPGTLAVQKVIHGRGVKTIWEADSSGDVV